MYPLYLYCLKKCTKIEIHEAYISFPVVYSIRTSEPERILFLLLKYPSKNLEIKNESSF